MHARTGLGDSRDATLSLVVLRSGALEGRCPALLGGCPALPGAGRPGGGSADSEPWLDSRSACAAALSAPASVALARPASLSLITTCTCASRRESSRASPSIGPFYLNLLVIAPFCSI